MLGYQLLVAEEESEVLGLMEFLIIPNISHRTSPWALIEGLVVSSQHRQRGLGKMLMQYALQKARETGCYKIELSSFGGVLRPMSSTARWVSRTQP